MHVSYIFALFFVLCLNTHVVTDLVTLLPREFNSLRISLFSRARAQVATLGCAAHSLVSPPSSRNMSLGTHIYARAHRWLRWVVQLIDLSLPLSKEIVLDVPSFDSVVKIQVRVHANPSADYAIFCFVLVRLLLRFSLRLMNELR